MGDKADLSRNRLIARCVVSGFTLKQVASVFGITGERVRQVAIRTLKKDCQYLPVSVDLTEIRKGWKNRVMSDIQEKINASQVHALN